VVYQVKGPYRAKASGLSCYYNLSGDPRSAADYQALGINKAYAYYHQYAIEGKLSGEAQAYINSIAAGQSVEITPLPPTQNLEARLNNFPVRIGADGHWRMDLGPELASNLAAVFVKLMYVSLDGDGGEGFRILWGTNRDLRADYQSGVFIEDFADTWGSIDGWNVHMEPIDMAEDRILYAVPILLNSTTGGMGEWKADEEYSLHVGCTYGPAGGREYEMLGAWKSSGDQRGIASKILRQLQAGDVIEPLHYPMLRNDDGELYIDYPPMGMGLLTVDGNTSFYDRSVGDGYYALLFEMIDYAGNRYYSREAGLRVRNGKIERLPGGIVPASAEEDQPLDSITGLFVHKHSDARAPYYTAIVSPEHYAQLADTLGLRKFGAGDDGGYGYTIQIYSDSFSMEPYVGMQKVYLVGEPLFEVTAVSQQRDIVFRVTKVVEVW